MPRDLLWDDVRCFFDPESMGALPDVHVPDTSAEDWQALLDLISASGWRYEYSIGDSVLPLPEADAAFSRLPAAETPHLRVWPAADVLAIFRFYEPEEIDFDVDIRELQGQEPLDILCDFLTAVGRQLKKPVLMNSEGAHEHPLLGYDVEANRVIRIADTW
jgi:hypothetical protein